MTDWQPIETAPRDGTPVDLWARQRGNHGAAHRYTDAFFSKEHDCWRLGQFYEYQYSPPLTITHWKPLDTPPLIASPAPETPQRHKSGAG